jgi:hypothetical protein
MISTVLAVIRPSVFHPSRLVPGRGCRAREQADEVVDDKGWLRPRK